MQYLTLNSIRRLPPALKLRLQVAYARAWEALTDTHQTQAAMFVTRLADRLPLEEALARYFREVAVPVAMRETVRARALLSVADAVPAVPGATDSADPTDSATFTSRNEDRVSTESVPMLEPADLVRLPKGQAFALIEGEQRHIAALVLEQHAAHDGMRLIV